MIDNEHNFKSDVDLIDCDVVQDPSLNSKWYNMGFCVDPDFNYLMGNYETPTIKSQLL